MVKQNLMNMRAAFWI